MRDGACRLRAGDAECRVQHVVQPDGGDAFPDFLDVRLRRFKLAYRGDLAGERDAAGFGVVLREKRGDAFENHDVRSVFADKDVAYDVPLDSEGEQGTEIIPMSKRANALRRRTAEQTQRIVRFVGDKKLRIFDIIRKQQKDGALRAGISAVEDMACAVPAAADRRLRFFLRTQKAGIRDPILVLRLSDFILYVGEEKLVFRHLMTPFSGQKILWTCGNDIIQKIKWIYTKE